VTGIRYLRGTVAALVSAVTVSAFAAPPEPPGFRLHGDAKRGQAAYLKRCAVCHGEAGDGRGKIALQPKPTDFTAPGVLAKRSDWEIYLAVRDGGQAIGLSPKMFGWGKTLSDQEIRDMSAFVRSLAPAP
jgi:cytochrome c oxidase cbb3-type subunit 3